MNRLTGVLRLLLGRQMLCNPARLECAPFPLSKEDLWGRDQAEAISTHLASYAKRWDSSRDARADERGTASGFDSMNSLVARLLTDLTASMRFAGDLNVDLNEITTNLVPFPRLHYLLSSISPIPASDSNKGTQSRRVPPAVAGLDTRPRRMAQMFSGAFSASNMLVQANPR